MAQREQAVAAEPRGIPKVPTRIRGLDEVLHGGLPQGRTTLLQGGAGSGKTVLGLECLVHSAVAGEPAILVSFEETGPAVRQNALTFGWDLESLTDANRFWMWEAKVDRRMVSAAGAGIDPLLAVVQGKAEQIGARLVMLDALDVLMRMLGDPAREREELYRLNDWLLERGFTAVLTAKAGEASGPHPCYEFLEYMADCVLLLDTRVWGQVTTRRLRVLKYRGSGFDSNEYPYLIAEQGCVVMPITSVALADQRMLGERITCGNQGLDRQLGGGIRRGSAVVVSGPTGSGKTTLAATFTQASCSRGEPVLYVGFEESSDAIVNTMQSPGIDLSAALSGEMLRFHCVMPESDVPERHLHRIACLMEEMRPATVVVDAISACDRMATEAAAFDFLVRLIGQCRASGVTCLMTYQRPVSVDGAQDRLMGIGSVIDTLIYLDLVDRDGRMERDLLIVKSRGTHHSNRHHAFRITDSGIHLVPPDSAEGGG